MNETNHSGLVKKEFDFGWKEGNFVHPTDLLVLEFQKGSLLDIGCGTCRLYKSLRQKGWIGRYVGIDAQRYKDYEYPDDVELMIGNALELNFPETDTVVLYYVLEHIEDPRALLSKAIKSCRENVLLCVPKRNEALWKHGVIEYHQLDKTHRHCGFSKEEIFEIVDLSGGEIRTYKDIGQINATVGISLWDSMIPKGIVLILSRIFSSKIFFADIWCEVVEK